MSDEDNKQLKSQFTKLENILDKGFEVRLKKINSHYFAELYDIKGEVLDYRASSNIDSINLNDFMSEECLGLKRYNQIHYPEYKDMLCQHCHSLPNEAGECPKCL